MSKKINTFDILSKVNVNDFTKKKGQLTYLSWSHAWAEVKTRFPDASYTYYVNPETNQPYSFEENVGGFCHTSVTISGETLSMWLPILNYSNKSEMNPKAFDINSCLMRCLTKNLAMFGLGFYIYKSESFPPDEDIDANDDPAPSSVSSTSKPMMSNANYKSILMSAKAKQKEKKTWKQIQALISDNFVLDIGLLQKLETELYG